MELDHIQRHIYRYGFDKSYRVWSFHGEVDNLIDDGSSNNEMDNMEENDTFWDMFSDLREAEMAGGSEDREDDNIGRTNTMGAEQRLRKNYMSVFEGA